VSVEVLKNPAGFDSRDLNQKKGRSP